MARRDGKVKIINCNGYPEWLEPHLAERLVNEGDATWPGGRRPRIHGGTQNATAFRDRPQRDDPTITNTYFNGPGDGSEHGHVKYRDNPDGTTDYLYVRDVEGNEYDV